MQGRKVHLSVTCPLCQSTYQVVEALRGKRMRCLNTICRAVFEVRAEGESGPPAVAPASENKPTGSVEEMVPLLPAEIAVPEGPPKKTTATPSWQTPPPVRITRQAAEGVPLPYGRGSDSEPGTVRSRSEATSQSEGGPLTPDPSPPQGRGEKSPAGLASLEPDLGELEEETSPAKKNESPRPARRLARRRSTGLIALLLALLAGIGTGGYLLVERSRTGSEIERFQKAEELYQNQEFAEAVRALQGLVRDFPKSKERTLYQFLAEWSEVRGAVFGPRAEGDDAADLYARVAQFLEIYKNDPLIEKRHGDIWETLQRLAKELAMLAEERHSSQLLERAQRAWAEAGKFQAPKNANVPETQRTLTAEFGRVAKTLAVQAARTRVLEMLGELAKEPSARGVRSGKELIGAAGLASDKEAQARLRALIDAHRAAVRFIVTRPEDALQPGAEDELPSVAFAPAVGKAAAAPASNGVVLALARGVLYAFEPARGDLRFVRRLGVDTTVLPLRVPASDIMPEMLLVLSSDARALLGIETGSGRVLWRTGLSDACLAQPVLIDRVVLVPTLSGRIEEIEITGGLRRGYYDLDQPSLVGGVRQPDTSLVYVAGESDCIYVLDVTRRQSAGILYTGHAPRSLIGPPLLWNEYSAPDSQHKGWLALTQASAAGTMELVPFALPIDDAEQKPANLKVTIPGAAAFSPWQDERQIALATDAGLLALYGIRQKGNRDPLLFPMFKQDYQVDSGVKGGPVKAMLVHVDAENYWVLVNGKLHRLQTAFTAAAGPGLVSRWPQPVHVGTPLHSAEARLEAGRLVLYLTTQDDSTCRLRAIDAEDGRVYWERQLGLTCHGPIVALGETLVCPDGDGFLFVDKSQVGRIANPSHDKSAHGGGKFWSAAGKRVPLDKEAARHGLLQQGDQTMAWTWLPQTSRLIVGPITPKGIENPRSFTLPAPPQGAPVLLDDAVLAPLANGLLSRLKLSGITVENGPEWRGVGVDESAPGFVVALGANEFALTDGSRTLTRYRWGQDKLWEKLSSAALPYRIVRAPVVWKGQLLAADAADTVTLLDAERLQVVRRWSPGGKITAGPFVRGAHVGVIVGDKRLVWLDPAQDQPLWEYDFVAAVVGEPNLLGEKLVVADLAGNITTLDAGTGRLIGSVYTFRANVVAAAAPVPWDEATVLIPLTDGTGVFFRP
ncbi:MAG: PQQ-binding-like beta-propeller repeat protein [Gemmataceae bacterium]|nr:PQQ-binding-like beta-propeller repeat protein [Gemmataceae bacterium]